jgi:phosphoserine aminotransferase
MAIYAVNRSLKWLTTIGGIEIMADRNLKKAMKLYDEIERNSLFVSPIEKVDRSLMNVPFIFSSEGRDDDFLSFCDKRGLKTLKGHRSVGGFRASIYNAMPEEGVDALVQAMKDYESI